MNTQNNLIEKTYICSQSKSHIRVYSFQIWFFTREYIKQFVLKFSPPDFNKFVHESIKDKIKTDPTSRVIWTRDKYLKAQNSVAAFTYREDVYIVNNTQTPSVFITSDLYLRANKSFVRDLSEIGHSQLIAEMIKELRK